MPKRVDWSAIGREYATLPISTYKSLSEKHQVSMRTLRWHSRREGWRMERARHCQNVGEKLTTKTASRSATTLGEINEAHLRRSDELRAMLDHRLKARGPDGKVTIRPDVSIRDICRAVMGYGLLYRGDRLALGVVDSEMPQPRNRLLEMTDEEIDAELQRVRKKPLLQ